MITLRSTALRALLLIAAPCALGACTESDGTARGRDTAHAVAAPPVSAPPVAPPVAQAVPAVAARESEPQLAAKDSNVVVDSSVTEPRVDRVNGRHVLHLPIAMDSALRALVPGFRATSRDAFEPSVAAWVWKEHPEASLFAVVADFDGDGRLDVAIRGSGGTVVVRNVVSGPRAECPEKCVEDSDVPRVGSVTEFIWLQKRGVVQLFSEDEDNVSVTIPHDAFENVYFEKASHVVYYQRGKWHLAATSD